jgi:hypothetical protein
MKFSSHKTVTDCFCEVNTYIEVLLEVNSILALVESRLLAHELPIEGSLFFERLVVEDLLIVGLHHNVLNHKF